MILRGGQRGDVVIMQGGGGKGNHHFAGNALP